MSTRPIPMTPVSFAVAALLVAGCSDEPGTSVESGENDFDYAANLSNVSDSQEYTWSVTRTTVDFEWSVVLEGGSVKVTVKDPRGDKVFEREESAKGPHSHESSMAAQRTGEWSVRIAYEGFSGQNSLDLMAS